MRKLRLSVTLITIAVLLMLGISQPLWAQNPQRQQPEMKIEAATRSEVIEAIIRTLDEYIFPEVAQLIQAELRTQLQTGAYQNITKATEFAQILTSQIQAINGDKHLRVFYSHKPFPLTGGGQLPTPEEQEKRERELAWENFGFYQVERKPGNIGYLDLRFFAEPEVGGDTAIAAWNFLSNTKGLIIDLRQNGGGSPDMIALISTYLFEDKPVHLNDLYWREREASGGIRERIEQHWTLPYVPGVRYGNKPVYVLTSESTFSGAEEFSYNLKQLKRATIIGETTGGGAHPGRFQPLHQHFGMFIPTGRAVNPITQTNWEGTGVEPDVKVSAELALKTAHLAALKDVLAQTTEAEWREELERIIATVEKE